MARDQRKTTHEVYHQTTRSHQKLISKGNFTYRHILPVIDRYISSQKKVLDIGCGSGTVSLYIASKDNLVEGIDISTQAIKTCQESATHLGLTKKTSFQVMDFPKVTPRKTYDVILLIEVLEHLPNDKETLKKLFQLLNTNGTIILSTPSKKAPLYRMGLAHAFDKRVGHLRRYTLQGLKKLCEDSGFTVIEEYGTEGVIRNFLFVNPYAGKLVRFMKFFIADVVTFLDNLTCRIFGESDIFIILKK